MSGGHFDYKNDYLAEEMFGWDYYPDYGESGREKSRGAAKVNPMHDVELSEMVWDVFCLIHSLDWYLSGDTGEDCYREDVKYFKDKWFGKTPEERLSHLVDNAVDNVREDLEKTLLVKGE